MCVHEHIASAAACDCVCACRQENICDETHSLCSNVNTLTLHAHRHTHACKHTAPISYVCDRGCQKLLLSGAALLAGESASWAKHTQKHAKHTHMLRPPPPTMTPTPENKSVSSRLIEASLKQRKAQPFTSSPLSANSMQLHSVYVPYNPFPMCVWLCACVPAYAFDGNGFISFPTLQWAYSAELGQSKF